MALASIAPLDSNQTEQLELALAGLSPAQLQWVSGFAAGRAAGPVAAAAPVDRPTLTILYGSQTGNGEAIARRLESDAWQRGYATRLQSLADFRFSALKREKLVTFVVSTHGEGDPPDDAELFRELLLSDRASGLGDLRYAVLALGDSSYVNFCQTGREFDERLAELGATRLLPLVECDVEYESEASAWRDGVLELAAEQLEATSPVPHLHAVETQPLYDRQRPLSAEVLLNQKLTGRDSTKDVRHIELSVEDSGLAWEPGDSLAVIAENPRALVDQLLEVFGADQNTKIQFEGEQRSAADVLRTEVEITAVNLSLLRKWAEYSASEELAGLLEDGDKEALSAFVDRHQIIDVVRLFPADVGLETFIGALRRLSARSYSIASSHRANPDEVHLTVAPVRYEAFGSEHWGAASTFLSDRVSEGEQINVYVESNTRFRLPDDATDIIMIGPGTGVAPFRAFVEERIEREASGRNWLFFGDRNLSSDFLYQLEWLRHLKQG
ncbi:MAG: flavodoxin domain-containing protein, partial [Woeseiaceae bacterium]|nr:flavodoxin domain-containing protein [Woeseiaceae bacterium]